MREDFGKEEQQSREGSFKKGVLAGVFGTLAVVVILSAAIAGILRLASKDRIQIAGKEEGQEALEGSIGSHVTDGAQDANSTDAEAGTLENVLNMDFLSEAAIINSYLNDYYLYDVDSEDIRDGMLMGMVAALGDPYSYYYNQENLSSFQDSTEGEYVGIGAAVTQEISTGIVRISKPYEGTPSAEAGLLPGDILVSVDGTQVTGMELSQVVTLIKGEEGTNASLNIYREEEEVYLDVEVERRVVEIPTVSSEILEPGIGYIEVSGFEGVTTTQFIQAYEELKAQGMQQVIVDLRNNGGGRVDTVESMLDYLLPEGTIFYVKDKAGVKSMEYHSDAEAALDIPMVVLVNENSASASEIFAGNIQEFGMGTVVGTKTYGKGVMQQLFYTNEERTAAVKLTVADYYIHSDKNINEVGITPDVEVQLDAAAAKLQEIPKEQDNQLQRALGVLKGQ